MVELRFYETDADPPTNSTPNAKSKKLVKPARVINEKLGKLLPLSVKLPLKRLRS